MLPLHRQKLLLHSYFPLLNTPTRSDEVVLRLQSSKLAFFNEPKPTEIPRNCSFVQEAHRVLLSPESELNTLSFAEGPVAGVDVLPRILLPLAGPEEFELEVCGFCAHKRVKSSHHNAGHGAPPTRTSVPPFNQDTRARSRSTSHVHRIPNSIVYKPLGTRRTTP